MGFTINILHVKRIGCSPFFLIQKTQQNYSLPFSITEAVCIPKSILDSAALSSVNSCADFEMTKNPS